jgi:hypothetical protein
VIEINLGVVYPSGPKPDLSTLAGPPVEGGRYVIGSLRVVKVTLSDAHHLAALSFY